MAARQVARLVDKLLSISERRSAALWEMKVEGERSSFFKMFSHAEGQVEAVKERGGERVNHTRLY